MLPCERAVCVWKPEHVQQGVPGSRHRRWSVIIIAYARANAVLRGQNRGVDGVVYRGVSPRGESTGEGLCPQSFLVFHLKTAYFGGF
jgi:hypothetical protein